MIIHHLNCGSLNLRFPKTQAIVYCLLVETNQGLALIDTGFGTSDYVAPSRRMKFFLYFMGVPGRLEETAVHQITELGFDAADVRHIVLTHLHLDHAGGLPDFPHAQVHVYRPEYLAAMKPRSLMEFAYIPTHWAHDPEWVFHDRPGRDWYGFESIPILDDLIPDILLVPLPGHTRGHCGVAVGESGKWLLQCGDAASPFHRDTDLHDREASFQHALKLPQWFVDWVIGSHVPRLRRLVIDHGDEVSVISGHDVFSFSEFGGVREGEAPRD